MEHITLKMGNDAEFDRIVREGLPEGQDLTIVTKDIGTAAGKPVVVLTFTVQQKDGTEARAQVVTTYNALEMAAAALRGRYGPGGFLESRTNDSR